MAEDDQNRRSACQRQADSTEHSAAANLQNVVRCSVGAVPGVASLQRHAEEQRQRWRDERARKHHPVQALRQGLTALKRTPSLFHKSIVMGREMASLAWQQPEHSLAFVNCCLTAALQAAWASWRQRNTLSRATGHAQEVVSDVTHIITQAPESAAGVIQAGAAAAADALHSIRHPSVGKLYAAAKEGAKAAVSAGEVVAAAPGFTLSAVKDVMETGAELATMPLYVPSTVMKTAWQSTQATTHLALLTAAAPALVSATTASITSLTKDLAVVNVKAASAARHMPGGKPAHVGMLVWLMPWIWLSVAAGTVLGAGRESAIRAVDGTCLFLAAAAHTAAQVVSWRVQGKAAEHVVTQTAAVQMVTSAARGSLAALQQRAGGIMQPPAITATAAHAAKSGLVAASHHAKQTINSLAAWQPQQVKDTKLQTPAGPLLPLLAFGMPGTRYEVPLLTEMLSLGEATSTASTSGVTGAGAEASEGALAAAVKGAAAAATMSTVGAVTSALMSTAKVCSTGITMGSTTAAAAASASTEYTAMASRAARGTVEAAARSEAGTFARRLTNAAREARSRARALVLGMKTKPAAGSKQSNKARPIVYIAPAGPFVVRTASTTSPQTGADNSTAAASETSIAALTTNQTSKTRGQERFLDEANCVTAAAAAPVMCSKQDPTLGSEVCKVIHHLMPELVTTAKPQGTELAAIKHAPPWATAALEAAHMTLNLLWAAAAATFYAATDTAHEVWQVLMQPSRDATLWHGCSFWEESGTRLHRVICLLLQLPIFVLALMLAAVDTLAWWARKSMSAPV